ncbi:MAG: histidine kinase [Actinobacteria bacterium]|nr:histidine kinase [Actinomycetota bacterium]
MTNPIAGVAQAERYTYQSLHWGLPMTPLLLVFYALVLRSDIHSWAVVGAVLASAVAAWAGLVVLHTGLRLAGDLAPGTWDRLFFAPARQRVCIVVWAVAALLTCVFASFLVPAIFEPGRFVDALTLSLAAATLAYPVFGLTRRRFPVYAVALGLVLACLAVAADLETLAYRIALLFPTVLWTGMWVLLTSMWVSVLQTTKELDRARHSSARLAVAEERLRFARDLHDVFGRTLSAVALKAELGAAQAEQGRSEAAATMHEVQAIATDALAEMRDLVRGYRETDLATEVAGARSLLEAVGIAVTTVIEAGPLPPAAARCLAWVVREGTTNVLRHAAATTVQLALIRDASGITLTLVNDGAGDVAPEAGSGLAGLTERLGEVGGTLSSQLQDGRWTLAAHMDQAALARLDEAGSSS